MIFSRVHSKAIHSLHGLALMLVLSPLIANAQQGSRASALTDEDARRIALERVPGTVVRVEREHERGRDIVEVHVRDARGTIQGVEIDDASHRVIRVEREEDDEAAEEAPTHSR